MTFKEIQELIKLVSKNDLSEFKLEQGDFKIAIRTTSYVESKQLKSPVIVPQQVPSFTPSAVQPSSVLQPASPTGQEAPPKPAGGTSPSNGKETEGSYQPIKSPMVGTFYRSSSPDKPPYVEVGTHVKKGDIVCIIEAMKLFNEVESEISGTIVKVTAENETPVEYNQALFLVDPD